MPLAAINGTELYFERHGDSGPPLVLVHGLTGDISDWRHQIAAFAPTYRVLVFDNRGHGRSPRPPDATFSVAAMAADAQELASFVGFDRYHLVGHSMGGAIAQEIAVRRPQALLSLTLHDTAHVFQGARFEPRDRPPDLPPERLSEVMARLSRMSPDTLLACWQALTTWEGTEQRAARIETPTLIIYGEHDAPFILEGSQRLAALIPNSALFVVAEAAHSPQEERPHAYNDALRRFLNRETI